jgi:hypothetical protein
LLDLFFNTNWTRRRWLRAEAAQNVTRWCTIGGKCCGKPPGRLDEFDGHCAATLVLEALLDQTEQPCDSNSIEHSNPIPGSAPTASDLLAVTWIVSVRIVTGAKHSDLPSQTVSPTHPLVRHRYAREGKHTERFEQRARRCRLESPQACAQEDDVSIRQGDSLGGSLLPGRASHH